MDWCSPRLLAGGQGESVTSSQPLLQQLPLEDVALVEQGDKSFSSSFRVHVAHPSFFFLLFF